MNIKIFVDNKNKIRLIKTPYKTFKCPKFGMEELRLFDSLSIDSDRESVICVAQLAHKYKLVDASKV